MFRFTKPPGTNSIGGWLRRHHEDSTLIFWVSVEDRPGVSGIFSREAAHPSVMDRLNVSLRHKAQRTIVIKDTLQHYFFGFSLDFSFVFGVLSGFPADP